MKLYFFPGSCSLAPHIALQETAQPFELEKVDLYTKRCADGSDYRLVNPKGLLPALRLDDGQVLTEVAVILQYVADRRPAAGLVPAAGTLERYRVQEALNFLASEVHKLFSVLFNPAAPGEWKALTREALGRQLDRLAADIDARDWLGTSGFSIADCYLFAILGWCVPAGVELARWPQLVAYQGRIAARPAVQKAMRAEGLVQ